jgi:serine phosphatase RsbU (regulator of sigma subunit)
MRKIDETHDDAVLGKAVRALYAAADVSPPSSLSVLLDVLCDCVSADSGRLFVADYALRTLREVGPVGPVGEQVPIDGTVAGHALAGGVIVETGTHPTVVRVPLVDGTERIGLIELTFDEWSDDSTDVLLLMVRTLVMLFKTKARYTDEWVRARRALPLSAAAEVQWDLLPPLAASATDVAVAGILEPAYTIGGDSFDYALNGSTLDFAIVDAVGHGMSAVLMAAAAINGLRNVRRESGGLVAAYEQVDELLATHFGHSFFVTGQFGSLDVATGQLRWINAGHVLPLLVRNGAFAGELACAPSRPMGLGGEVVEIAEHTLQSGDRVLFYSDGITESRSGDGEFFGPDRLADYLVRSTLDRVSVEETVRRLSSNILAFTKDVLNDDATMFLVEYRVPRLDEVEEKMNSGVTAVSGRGERI